MSHERGRGARSCCNTVVRPVRIERRLRYSKEIDWGRHAELGHAASALKPSLALRPRGVSGALQGARSLAVCHCTRDEVSR